MTTTDLPPTHGWQGWMSVPKFAGEVGVRFQRIYHLLKDPEQVAALGVEYQAGKPMFPPLALEVWKLRFAPDFKGRQPRNNGTRLSPVVSFDLLLTEARRLQDHLENIGIKAIVPPRSDPITQNELDEVLQGAKSARVQGVACKSLFNLDEDAKGPGRVIRHKLRNDEEFDLRVIVLDPESPAARARAFAEQGTSGFNTLLETFRVTVGVVRDMLAKAQQCSRFHMEIGFTDYCPGQFVVLTEEVGFLEPYSLGRPEGSELGCFGGHVPMLEVLRGSTLYSFVEDSFDYLWDQYELSRSESDGVAVKNRFIKWASFEEVAHSIGLGANSDADSHFS